MGANTKIEWAHHTFNPWRGCTKVSAGCANCYADTLSKRNPLTLGVWGPNGTRVVAAESAWREPLKWDRAAKAAGERHRVFCASLADVFEGIDTMPAESWEPVAEARVRLFKMIAIDTPNLDWLLLTKRPENVKPVLDAVSERVDHYAAESIAFAWNLRVWLGTSVENQAAADARIPHLISAPAAVRFLSCEPLLGPVDLSEWLDPVQPLFVCQRCGDEFAEGEKGQDGRHPYCGGEGAPNGETEPSSDIHWVIAGGESGPGARPMHPDWARSLRDQCRAAGVAFHFKQWGEFVPYEHTAQAPFLVGQHGHEIDGHLLPAGLTDSANVVLPGGWMMDECNDLYRRVGKKEAGRLLDGRTWDEVPGAVS